MGVEDNNYYDEQYDLQNCEKEPLRRIRRAQSYGSFLSCDRKGDVWYYASEDISELFKSKSIHQVILEKTGIDFNHIAPIDEPQFLSKDSFLESLIIHTKDFGYLIEIEPTDNDSKINIRNSPYQDVIIKLSQPLNQEELMNEVIHQVYHSTGYDHIMIYKFDNDYSGEIIAEKKLEELPSYLGLKFPATDIPEQARKLYFTEKVRIIHDATSEGKIIVSNSQSNALTLDLTDISMRGVSPIHREYLSNMGVQSSFSVAIIIDSKLWGLIACHNRSPKFVNYNTRIWLKFLSELISVNWEKVVNCDTNIGKINSLLIRSKLMENILTSHDLIEGLLNENDNIMELIPSNAVIIKSKEEIKFIGNHPDKSLFKGLFEWLDRMERFEVKVINKSKGVIPDKLYSPLAAGMLILQLSEASGDYIIWLRQEKSIDVVWAGNPGNTKKYDPIKGRMTPRKSFEGWKETVSDTAEPWSDAEIQIAKNLKEAIKDHLYKKYNEVLMLNNELTDAYAHLESFSYSVSHDLKAPLRSIEGFSQILKEDYADVLDKNGLHLLNIITESISKMKTFIHEILNYSKLNKKTLDLFKVDINEVIENQWKVLNTLKDKEPTLEVDSKIPNVYGDPHMIDQLFLNLLSNSLKYVDQGVQPQIKISYTKDDKVVNISIEDNGIGIPTDQREKVFEVFKRLVSNDMYEGSGVGLSTVKKVVERHGGKITISDTTIAETGTKFEFSLPVNSSFTEIMSRRN